jgi:hypothetical protein
MSSNDAISWTAPGPPPPSPAASIPAGAPTGERVEEEQQQQLVAYLEVDQLSVDRARPLPPATLGRAARIALWALRVFVTIVGAMVIYTFIAQLAH